MKNLKSYHLYSILGFEPKPSKSPHMIFTFIGLWFSAYSVDELTDDIGVRKGTCFYQNKMSITMTGNQTFIFFDNPPYQIKIDGRIYYTGDKKGIYLDGTKATIEFKQTTKYIVYFLPRQRCSSAIFGFGGKNNKIKFHTYSKQDTCVFIPTFDNYLEATYSFGSDSTYGHYKLFSAQGEQLENVYSNGLFTMVAKEAYGLFETSPQEDYVFQRKLDMNDDSFVDMCYNAETIPKCSSTSHRTSCDSSSDVTIDNLSCIYGGISIGVIVAIVIIAIIVITIIPVLICYGVCACCCGVCCGIFKHKSSSSSSSSKKDFQEPIAINTGYQPQPGYQQPGYYQYPPQQTYVQEPAAPVYQQQPQVYQPQQPVYQPPPPQNNEQQPVYQPQDPPPKEG